MNIEEILTYLCVYDERNPNNALFDLEESEKPLPRSNCFCDNCFYGRDKLAFFILGGFCNNCFKSLHKKKIETTTKTK
jgi:hypothetical protein